MRQNKDGEVKWCKQFGRFSLVYLFLVTVASAESFADFKQAEAQAFSKYKDERDAEFNNYLKAQWKEYNAQLSKPLYEKPKPKNITPTVQKKIKSIGPKINIVIKKPKVVPKKIEEVAALPKEIKKEPIKELEKPKVIAKVIDKPKEIVEKPKVVVKEILEKPKKPTIKKVEKVQEVIVSKDVNFNFFGQKLGFNIDSSFKRAKFYPYDQSGILNFFDTMASSDYESTIAEIQATASKLKLNDWGVYQLVTQFSEHVTANKDDNKLLSWFIFNKLGYEVKVGLANKHVILMHYSKKIIYSTPNYSFNSKKFYVVANYAKGSVGKLYTYKQSYPGANKAMDLELSSLPNFEANLKRKSVSFRQLGKEYSASYHYDQNLIDFMATYPQADYETYFNSPMNESTYKEIATDLKKYVNDQQASVAINFVLNFVQKAFKYERDHQQFGREKVMFADETLYYSKSDCEDRAILFSYLVKELFGVGVIGVKYSDHMATALYIPMEGDSVKAGRRKFVIADPTYINANIGQSMPKYKRKTPDSFIIVKRDD